MHAWDGRAPKVGEKAPELSVLDPAGKATALSSVAAGRPLIVLVFSGVDDLEGLRLLRDYRDETLAIWRAGGALCAVAPADPAALRYLRSERALAFPLLADPEGAALASWGMLRRSGVFLLDGRGVIKQRAVGAAAAPDAVISILRRGGARRSRPKLRERAAHLAQVVQHAFRTLRPAR